MIKISSMGDLIHTLPALTDAQAVFPNLTVDWIADPAFAEIPRWHPAVNRVIPAPLRHWKKNKWKTLFSGKIGQFKSSLRTTKYDLILDAQAALKTALLATLAQGPRAGMDRHSVREYGAHLFYQQRYFIDKAQHAIARTRQLFAHALGYTVPASAPDFGLQGTVLPTLSFTLPKRYIVAVHATTWKTKHWQPYHWRTLITHINDAGFEVVLPFGSPAERQSAQQIAQPFEQVQVLPKLSLSECAAVLAKASGAICVDTGLGHLTAALDIPAIHLYGPTDPHKIGAPGANQTHWTTDFACAPCYKKTCPHAQAKDQNPVCLDHISPQQVWQQLNSVIHGLDQPR